MPEGAQTGRRMTCCGGEYTISDQLHKDFPNERLTPAEGRESTAWGRRQAQHRHRQGVNPAGLADQCPPLRPPAELRFRLIRDPRLVGMRALAGGPALSGAALGREALQPSPGPAIELMRAERAPHCE